MKKNNGYWIIFLILVVLSCIMLFFYPVKEHLLEKEELNIVLLATFVASLYTLLYIPSFVSEYKVSTAWTNKLSVIVRLCLPGVYVIAYLIRLICGGLF